MPAREITSIKVKTLRLRMLYNVFEDEPAWSDIFAPVLHVMIRHFCTSTACNSLVSYSVVLYCAPPISFTYKNSTATFRAARMQITKQPPNVHFRTIIVQAWLHTWLKALLYLGLTKESFAKCFMSWKSTRTDKEVCFIKLKCTHNLAHPPLQT